MPCKKCSCSESTNHMFAFSTCRHLHTHLRGFPLLVEITHWHAWTEAEVLSRNALESIRMPLQILEKEGRQKQLDEDKPFYHACRLGYSGTVGNHLVCRYNRSHLDDLGELLHPPAAGAIVPRLSFQAVLEPPDSNLSPPASTWETQHVKQDCHTSEYPSHFKLFETAG